MNARRFLMLLIPFPVLLVACAPSADIDAIEQEVRSGIQRQLGVMATVDCPSEIEWWVGGTFNCIADSSSERAMVTVTMQNDKGEYTWEVR